MNTKKKSRISAMLVVMSAAFAGAALAAVSADEAKQLGGAKLTAFGAEKAGNKEGTIPAYTGEGVDAPGNYDPKEPGQRPDPWNEKPLFTITARNAEKYADKLDGMVEMFKRYPNFRMDIYPSHRTATYPKYVLDGTAKNATQCKAVDNELRLEGCYGGIVFPIPKSGNQVMWNKLTSFETHSWAQKSLSYLVASNGQVTLISGIDIIQQSPFHDPTNTAPAKSSSVYWQVRTDSFAPARKVGEKLVLIDSLDNLNLGRRAYQYIPGQRRVKLAPDLSYDTPSPNAGGLATMDDAKGFLGPLDRYDWKLVGKKEKYIMYNSFGLQNYKVCLDEKQTTKDFANPDCVRWELHRVWVVQATLKPGFRHIYPKRMVFVDEDSYNAGQVENYDQGNQLYRVIIPISFPYWRSEGGGQAADNTLNYDFHTGSWSFQGAQGFPGGGAKVTSPANALLFSPEALAGEGIR